MEDFRECLGDCGLADLVFTGYPFTWDNKQDQGTNIHVRLDRATCNDEFLNLFPKTAVEHILTQESDHEALIIRVAATPDASRRKKAGGFRYEEARTRHDDYEQMFVRVWEQTNQQQGASASMGTKLRAISKAMQTWSREVFGSLRRQISKLKDAKERSLVTGFFQEVKDIESQLHDLHEKEEIYCKQ